MTFSPEPAPLSSGGAARGDRVRVAVIGLGFGAEFLPIYQAHPGAELTAVCQRDRAALALIADRFGVDRMYTSVADVLADPDIDAVHINTPIADHAAQTIAALEAGKHVACTVPMALSLDECATIVAVERASGRTYMMMETAVYTREFMFAKLLRDTGRLGRIQFLRGAHIQNMAGWPAYWRDMAPMQYATHAVAPLFALAGSPASRVWCVGSGTVDRSDGSRGPGHAVETAVFRLKGSGVAVEATRSLYEVERTYTESFDVYGSLLSLEWAQLEGEDPIMFEDGGANRVTVPDFAHTLPDEIRRLTRAVVYNDKERHLSFTQGGGHGGSHPHLVHEFVTSILEGRAPFPDAVTAANWTSAGICAHVSAMTGREVEIPVYG